MIFFVGPLPPPLHGFSAINGKMLNRLQNMGDVTVFNMAPSGGGRAALVFQIVRTWLSFFFGFLFKRPRSVYIGFSGGYRQLLDAAFVIVARGFGVPIFVHHHSFAYLNESSWVSSACIGLLRNSTHIVLCDFMGEKLAVRYGVATENIKIVSNAAFLDEPFSSIQEGRRGGGRLKVGFLSNITASKGIFDYFDLFDLLSKMELPIDGVVAGPVDSAVAEVFEDRIANLESVRHVGPVYGEFKESFLLSLDLLVFPTRYVNEAEPVTILEALSYGVPVVAVERGCIRSMLPEEAGRTVSTIEQFVEIAMIEIQRMLLDPEYHRSRRKGALRYFASQRKIHQQSLDNVLMQMVCPVGRVDERGG